MVGTSDRVRVTDSAESDSPVYACEDFAVEAHSPIEQLDGGMIRVKARLARTGIQEYAPWPGVPSHLKDRKVRLYRPPEEVFDAVSLSTLRSNPITLDHPPTGEVTADSWKAFAVGHVEGHEVKRATVDGATDGHGEDFIETSLVISDAKAVKAVQSKERSEFSSGYAMSIDWTPGEYKGVAYDGIQRSIRHNHQALLKPGNARAGREARIVDSRETKSNSEDSEVKFEELKKALEDAKAENAELKAKLADSADASELKTKLDASEAKVKELETKLADAEKKVGEMAAKQADALDAKEVSKLVDEQLELRDSVRGMLPADYAYKGKTPHELKLDAIKHCKPKVHAALGEKPSEAIVDGAFAVLVGDKTSYVAPKNQRAKDAAGNEQLTDHEAHTKRMQNDAFAAGWKGKE